MHNMNPESLQDDTFFFLHIAKTGGSTIKAIIQNQFDINSIFPGYYLFDLKGKTLEELARYKLFIGHLPYSLVEFLPHRPHCITFLRDPLERTLSHLEFIRREVPQHHLYPLLNDSTLSFAEIVRHKDVVPEIKNWQLYSLATKVSGAKIIEALEKAETPLEFSRYYQRSKEPLSDLQRLELAKAYLDEFFFVGITERLEQSVQVLSYLFGAPPIRQLQSLNIARKRTQQHDLPADVLAYINELTYYDRLLYDYANILFQRQYAAMVDDLLESDYAAHYREKEHSALDRVNFTFEEKLSGTGWHQRELSTDDNPYLFRWTGPGTESTLDMHLTADRDFVVEAQIVRTARPEIVHNVYFSANGVPLETTITAKGKEYLATAQIPRQILENSPYTRLTIHTTDTVPLSTLGNPSDQRKVGVAISRIEIKSL